METIYASPTGGDVEYQGATVKSYTLGVAVNRATPGDVVQLIPGVYESPISVSTSGTSRHPITIRGENDVRLDGGRNPEDAVGDDMTPSDDDFAFIKLQSASWINIEDLSFLNCWPCVIFARGCRDIAMRNCSIVGSRYVFFARNKRGGIFRRGIKSKRITLDGVSWIQDPDHDMWTGEASWRDVKGYNPGNDRTYFNGSLFGSWDIRGYVTIRNCDVSHAFNAIRMDCKADPDLQRNRNLNVRIHDNRFDHIRDNAVEPESSAINWWVYRNEIFNGHALFSLHNISGGYWYLFANKAWFDSKPGKPGQKNRGGKVLKFIGAPYPAYPVYIVYNSFFIRSSYTKDGQTRNLKHHNNAIEFCFSGPHCSADRKFFSDDETHFIWHHSYEFDQDLSNHPEYPDKFPTERNYSISGVQSGDIFRAPGAGNLVLKTTSPGRNAATGITIRMPFGEHVVLSSGFHIGAEQDSDVFSQLQYREYSPDS